jgi:hypothetical protein
MNKTVIKDHKRMESASSQEDEDVDNDPSMIVKRKKEKERESDNPAEIEEVLLRYNKDGLNSGNQSCNEAKQVSWVTGSINSNEFGPLGCKISPDVKHILKYYKKLEQPTPKQIEMVNRLKKDINQYTTGLVISTVRSLTLALQEDVPFHTYSEDHPSTSRRKPKLVDPQCFVRYFRVALSRKQ